MNRLARLLLRAAPGIATANQSRSTPRTMLWAALLGLSLLSAPSIAADVTSTLQGSGDWTNDAIWDSTLHPDNGNGGFTYDAIVNFYSVNLAEAEIEIESLFLSGGAIGGLGELTLNAASQWTAGTLAGPGADMGALTLSGDGYGGKPGLLAGLAARAGVRAGGAPDVLGVGGTAGGHRPALPQGGTRAGAGKDGQERAPLA